MPVLFRQVRGGERWGEIAARVELGGAEASCFKDDVAADARASSGLPAAFRRGAF